MYFALQLVFFQHLTAILEFMYAGEVNVAQDQLPQFLKTAERLKVSTTSLWLENDPNISFTIDRGAENDATEWY